RHSVACSTSHVATSLSFTSTPFWFKQVTGALQEALLPNTMSRLTFLPLEDKPIPGAELAAGGVYDVFTKNSSWVWITESGFTVPNAPANEQRAFRKTFTNTNPSKVPITATIILSVDNYYALHVNGILLHALDLREAWEVPITYTDPAVGRRNAAFRMTVRIGFADGSTQWVFTGQDQSWLTKKLFEEGWEQPGYDDRDWQPAFVLPPSATAPWGNLGPPAEAFGGELDTFAGGVSGYCGAWRRVGCGDCDGSACGGCCVFEGGVWGAACRGYYRDCAPYCVDDAVFYAAAEQVFGCAGSYDVMQPGGK
ncbi:hypothetical protein DFP72DRAFT_1129645, partial [Ephemerocybe angulata]